MSVKDIVVKIINRCLEYLVQEGWTVKRHYNGKTGTLLILLQIPKKATKEQRS